MATLHNKWHAARKAYHDDALWLFNECGFRRELSDDEREVYAQRKALGFQILPGERYRKCVVAEDGTVDTFRYSEALDGILHAHNAFDVAERLFG